MSYPQHPGGRPAAAARPETAASGLLPAVPTPCQCGDGDQCPYQGEQGTALLALAHASAGRLCAVLAQTEVLLDQSVQQAAAALTEAYGKEAETRYSGDRTAGGAWLLTPDGWNADVGITVSTRARPPVPAGPRAVGSYIRGGAVRDPRLATELAQLPGWKPRAATGVPGGFHDGPADGIAAAVARCLHFVPREEAR